MIKQTAIYATKAQTIPITSGGHSTKSIKKSRSSVMINSPYFSTITSAEAGASTHRLSLINNLKESKIMTSETVTRKTRKTRKIKKLVFGVGINDADYTTQPKVNGKVVCCPYFRTWKNILIRCYYQRVWAKQPTYSDCTVCDEWLTFSNFKAWMELQSWEGMDIDKDIRIQGNKIYGPDTCVFVPGSINSLLIERGAARGEFPIGVYYNKKVKKFIASGRENLKRTHLGVFDTPSAAHEAYKADKSRIIRAVATDINQPISIYARLGLLKKCEKLLEEVNI